MIEIRNKEKFIGSIVIFTTMIIFLIVGYVNTKPEKMTEEEMKKMFVETPEKEEKKESVTETKSNNDTIVVEIKGEVNKPDVYILNEESRIFELIEMAGGITAEGNLESVNRASTLVDGQCIIIGNINDNNVENPVSNIDPVPNNIGNLQNKININKASKEELMTLSGIGESKAEAIISYRQEAGAFKQIEDLKNVDGIGEKTVEKLKNKISVN